MLLELHVLERQPRDIVVGSHVELDLQYAVFCNSTCSSNFLHVHRTKGLTIAYINSLAVISLQLDTCSRSLCTILHSYAYPSGNVVFASLQTVHCSGQGLFAQ